LKPSLTHSHWAGLTEHTQGFPLALSCVFVKQSHPPGHCEPSISGRPPLIPKIRGQIAEFPGVVYPVTPPPFQREPPASVLNTDANNPTALIFTATGNLPNPGIHQDRSSLHLLLSMTELRRIKHLACVGISPIDLSADLCHHMYVRGTGILTGFPFHAVR